MEFCEIMAYENGGNGFVWFGVPAIFLENVRSSAAFFHFRRTKASHNMESEIDENINLMAQDPLQS